MKGVILAGGTGSRLFPLTKVTNKHLLPIYNKPMIYYPLEALKSAGIRDILVITGVHHAGAVFSLLGSGSEFDVKFTYKVQDKPEGIPSAISLAEDFIDNEKFISINGDNIVFESLDTFAKEFERGKEKARILLSEQPKEVCQKSGVAILDGDNVIRLVEKPKDPPTNWVSVGIYMYTPDVFKVIKKLKPSQRGETEITDVNNVYIDKGSLKASKLKRGWVDAGTVDDLMRASQIVYKNHSNKY